jgi:hypothetical protein
MLKDGDEAVHSYVEDYAAEGTAENMWSQYDGKQPGDPAKLGEVLVKIAPSDTYLFTSGTSPLRLIHPMPYQ